MPALRRPAIVVSALLLLWGLSPGAANVASAAVPRDDGGAEVSADLWRAYRAAIVDSTTATPSEVVTDLLVPTPADPRTQWRTIDGEDYLLVGLLRYALFPGVNEGEQFTVSGDRWVSIPGDLGRACTEYRCRRMTDAGLDLQLKMIIGLPPDADYRYIMHFWVKPSDMFRPCTDPRVTSTSCPEQVVTDASGQPIVPVVGTTATSAFLWTQANYAWRLPDRFRPGTAVSCAKDWTTQSCYGYPWTRLGYTYDWTPGAADDVGVSEFVVVKGATAYMESMGLQRDFFPRP